MFSFSKIFKYIWPQIRKYQRAFYSIIVLFALRVVFDFIVIPIYFKKIIDTISNSDAGRTMIAHDLFKFVFIIIVLNIVVALTARSRQFIYYKFLINVIRNLRNFAFQKIELNSQTFFANTFAGGLVTKSRRFVNAFEVMLGIFVFDFLSTFIILVGVFIVLIKESPTISFVFFGLIIVYLVTISFFVRKKMKYDILEAEQDSRISGRLADIFSNISAVKFFSARRDEITSFGKYTDEGASRSKKAMYFSGKIQIMQSIFTVLIQSVVLYIMVHFWINNKISTGTVVLIQTYMVLIFNKLWDLSEALTRFMKSISDMKETIDIFEIVPDILDPENGEKLKMNDGHIVFENVSFEYNLGQDIFSDFNLDIKPGERIGIVGHSGAGKSTITKLLLRFNDVTNGTIRIDGQDIKNVTQDDLRSVISYVPQEPVLFHRPVRENIAYGKPYASEAEIIEVSKKAHAHEFISVLPHGYDTRVGERGVKLSGGERQRVAIARAMLKDSPILLLDEATSSLDSISESYIQEALNELMKAKTTIVIAHRLSTIQKMDRIIVLEKGRIVEEGTHKDLLEKKGFYANLWDHQTGGFLQ
jgi:ATP-binding cassette subfamily B protein